MKTSDTPTRPRIEFMDSHLELALSDSSVHGYKITISTSRLPEDFVRWQLEARQRLFSSLLDRSGHRIAGFSPHLPVLVSRLQNGSFPFHTANKGTGLLPVSPLLEEFTATFKTLLRNADVAAWGDTLGERVRLMRALYSSAEQFDTRCLGSLEIFQGQTYRNIFEDPRVSLHYTGDGPTYPSFQVNAVAEVVHPGDPRFEFLYWARQLFEHDHFHIQQPAYPSGYVFWVSEVFDKSPAGHAGRRIA